MSKSHAAADSAGAVVDDDDTSLSSDLSVSEFLQGECFRFSSSG